MKGDREEWHSSVASDWIGSKAAGLLRLCVRCYYTGNTAFNAFSFCKQSMKRGKCVNQCKLMPQNFCQEQTAYNLAHKT